MSDLIQNVDIKAAWRAEIQCDFDNGDEIDPGYDLVARFFEKESDARRWIKRELIKRANFLGGWNPQTNPYRWSGYLDPGSWAVVDFDEFGQWVSWEDNKDGYSCVPNSTLTDVEWDG